MDEAQAPRHGGAARVLGVAADAHALGPQRLEGECRDERDGFGDEAAAFEARTGIASGCGKSSSSATFPSAGAMGRRVPTVREIFGLWTPAASTNTSASWTSS